MTTIFICTDWFYPAYKAGGPVQSIVNLVQQYHHEGVEFKIFSSNHDLDGTISKGVTFDDWVYFNEYTAVWYASPGQYTPEIFRRELKNTGASMLFIIGMFSWYTNQPTLLWKANHIKRIISVRGMLHPGALSQKPFKKKIYLSAWKITGLYKRFYFHATDEQELQYIREVFGPKASVLVANNFPRVIPFQPAENKQPGQLKMISIALLGPMKNILLVLQALQNCKANIDYIIYGPVKDETYWALCLEQVKKLPANITVQYKGDLPPTEVKTELGQAEVFILPSKSENFGHALYEALSAGKPIITSMHTPFNQLHEQFAGQNVSIENVAPLTAAIDFFAGMQSTEFSQWNLGASAYAHQHLNLESVHAQYDQLFATGVA